jgi:hypothetical protein
LKIKKLKLSLCLTKFKAMKAYLLFNYHTTKTRGNGGTVPHILELGIRWSEWSASRPGCFTPGTHWVGDWVGSSACLDAVATMGGPSPVPAGNRTLAVQPAA